MNFNKWKTQITFITCLGILISFQNCAVYENEGRLFLDSRETLPKGPDTEVFEGCLPYISDAIIQDILILNIETEMRESIEFGNRVTLCTITGDNASNGIYSPTCSISAFNKSELENYNPSVGLSPPADFPSSGEEYESTSDTGTTRSYLRYARLTDIDGTPYYKYAYHGADSTLSRGVLCSFLIQDDNPGSQTETIMGSSVESDARELVDKILDGVADNG